MQAGAELRIELGKTSGKRHLAKGTYSGLGTKTISKTQSTGFKVGRVKAINGILESMEGQVQQTLDRGWALRPKSTCTTEVENEGKRGARWVTAGAGEGTCWRVVQT
jgi:hypothetical protein